jgi:5-methylcytosine-specific restriction endonuclease McrA
MSASSEWYHRNKERVAAYKKASRDIVLAVIREAKLSPCTDCGDVFHYAAMDFDHVRGTKLFGIAQSSTRNLDEIRKEMEKCDLVCANCHRVRTYNRKKKGA